MAYGDKKLEGGHAASHKILDELPVLVAPSHGKEKNTIREELITIACWKLDDVRFRFDSSFILASAKPEFTEFAEIYKSVPGAPISLFGHADPVGDDNYNKKLSGRRAKAIYGVLTRDTAVWEQLYSNSDGTSDDWNNTHIGLMQEALGQPKKSLATAKDRATLFKAYMDLLCPVTVQKSEFLGGGASPSGRGDYQGCSEFNPLMLFSEAENKKFSASADKTERNAENQLNRRVLGLFFRPGTKVPLDKWPCPAASEGTSGCTHRFWSDHAKRRQFGAKRRTFAEDGDTFACRFYERLVRFSPCEVPADTPAQVYLRLRFEDPDGVIRDFPENYPVTVRFSPPGPSADPIRERRCIVSTEGKLSFPAFDDPKEYWRSFYLEFDASPAIPYIVCEPNPALVSPPPAAYTSRYATQDDLNDALQNTGRFFRLPTTFKMPLADWTLGEKAFYTGNGEYASPPGLFKHTAPKADIGTPSTPVELILNPNWHFVRFEYFDRYYGNAHLDSPPRPAHRRRISTPPLRLRGYRTDPNAASSTSDAYSNWTTGAASPPAATDIVQALPFILRRETPGGPDFSPPSGAQLGLRFRTPEGSSAYSESFEKRYFVTSPPPAPGPDRLRFYDLPRVWKSKHYYARRLPASPPTGKFFQDLTADEITSARKKDNPLVFSLDDMVMFTGNQFNGKPLRPLTPKFNRVSIFNHRFDSRLPDSSPQGLYKLLSPPGPDELDLPRSNVSPPVNNYLHDYPDWTRLVLAGGNLLDVFDKRTPDDDSPPHAVGARAAVRWMDATKPINGISAFVWDTVNGGWIPAPDDNPLPGRVLSPPTTPRTDVPAGNPIFSFRPFFQQRMAWTQTRYTGDDSQIGRYDLALLRCSDVQNGEEIAPTFTYFRQNFDWMSPPPPTPQVPVPLAISRPMYALLQAQNVANRWTGDEPGVSEHRAIIYPQAPAAGSPPPFKSPSVWFLQHLDRDRSHFGLQLTTGGRDNRGSMTGGGDTGNTSFVTQPNGVGDPSNWLWFTSAHETGHMAGLPDEYNERWNAGSYGHMSFAWNTPGDPYEPDGRDETDRFSRPDSGMMNGNKLMRNRYFWHTAEFVRQVTGTKMRVALGPDYPDYFIPEHAQAPDGRTHYCWPLALSVGPANTANRGFDMYLYALGKDHYSQRLLAGGPPKGPFDGILIIDVKIAFTLPSHATEATRDAIRQDLLARANATVRQLMNGKWYVAGTVNVNGQNVTLRRCLIQAVPQAAVINHPHDPSPPPDGGEQQNAATMVARFGWDFHVRVTNPAPAAATWNAANPERLDVTIANNRANFDALFIRHFPRMIFGADKDLSAAPPNATAVTTADWVPIVQRLIPGATVHTLP